MLSVEILFISVVRVCLVSERNLSCWTKHAAGPKTHADALSWLILELRNTSMTRSDACIFNFALLRCLIAQL